MRRAWNADFYATIQADFPEYADVDYKRIPLFGNLALRDCIDFRPRVAVTANITTTSTNITTNPATVNSTSKYIYSGSVLKFPVPDSNFTSDVTHYMGRIDRIVVDKFSQIRDLEGRPGLDKTDLAAPLQPADTITIGQVYIPPYPSIPLQKSFILL